jgi:hypothetical protein
VIGILRSSAHVKTFSILTGVNSAVLGGTYWGNLYSYFMAAIYFIYYLFLSIIYFYLYFSIFFHIFFHIILYSFFGTADLIAAVRSSALRMHDGEGSPREKVYISGVSGAVAGSFVGLLLRTEA